MTKTTKQKIEALESVAKEIGGEIRLDYSGRSMFGETCVGIVCEDYAGCIEAAADAGIFNTKIDSMGQDYIVYWPSIVADEETLATKGQS